MSVCPSWVTSDRILPETTDFNLTGGRPMSPEWTPRMQSTSTAPVPTRTRLDQLSINCAADSSNEQLDTFTAAPRRLRLYNASVHYAVSPARPQSSPAIRTLLLPMVTARNSINPLPSSMTMDELLVHHVPQVSTRVFTNPISLLDALGIELENRAMESNIIYAHAYKLACQLRSKEITTIAPGQFWIACYSRQNQVTTLELVLSCTEGALGPYPIFIHSHRPASEIQSVGHRSHLETCISSLCTSLYRLVPPIRVFSVFSLSLITRIFATQWTSTTDNIYPVTPSPWYAATSSYCTIETFRRLRVSAYAGHAMQRATIDNLDQCAKLCEDFARTGPPYGLSSSQSRKEAEGIIQAKQLWVYLVPAESRDTLPPRDPTQEAHPVPTAVATIVAVTRCTPSVSAITKVYTSTAYRNRGYAEKLVAHVTSELLSRTISGHEGCPRVEMYARSTNKSQAVVLFVGHTLDATRVYQRVGFVGLGEDNVGDSVSGKVQVDGVGDWLELGFEGASLGHW